MAYFTEINYGRALTESEQQQVTDYITAQTTAGTTDGNLYSWQITGSETAQLVRMWSTFEAANGLITLANSFTPPAASAKVF